MNKTIYSSRDYFRPLAYEWAWAKFEQSEDMHWTHKEIPLTTDVNDYNKTTQINKQMVRDILRLFTQSDIDIGRAYYERYLPVFKLPELRAMLGSFAAREAIHFAAYSQLNTTLGFPDEDFKSFLDIPEMVKKHTYLDKYFNSELSQDPIQQYKEIAVFSLFVEGFSLFSSFGTLISFAIPEVNLYRGMKNVVAYSIKDENVHVQGNSLVALTIEKEHYELDFEEVKREIRDEIAVQCWHNEVDFVNYLFRNVHNEKDFHLTKNNVINYLGKVLEQRLAIFGIDLPSAVTYDKTDTKLDEIVNKAVGVIEHANFFETRSTSYVKGGVDWSMSDSLNYPLG